MKRILPRKKQSGWKGKERRLLQNEQLKKPRKIIQHFIEKPVCRKEGASLNIPASPLENSNNDVPSYSQEEGEINKFPSCTHDAFK